MCQKVGSSFDTVKRNTKIYGSRFQFLGISRIRMRKSLQTLSQNCQETACRYALQKYSQNLPDMLAKPPEFDQKSIKNRSKSITNHQKLRFGAVLEGLGVGLGTILRPRAAPKAPEAKKVTESSLNPRSFPLFWGPQNHIF